MGDSDFGAIAEPLKTRAKRARKSAWLSVILIVTTVFTMIVFFYGNGIFSNSYLSEVAFRINDLEKNAFENIDSKNSDETEAIKKMKIELELKQAELNLKRAELDKAAEESSRMTRTITDSFTKVGAVVISIYLIQILLSLMRYHFKLADHLETISEAMKIADNDVGKLEKIMSVIGVDHIEFGKSPETPTNKLVEIVRELSSNVREIQQKPNDRANKASAKGTESVS